MDNSIDIVVEDMTMTGESDQMRDEDFGPLIEPGCESAAPEVFPRLWNMSAGHMVRGVIRAEAPVRPEYVAVPMRSGQIHPPTRGPISRVADTDPVHRAKPQAWGGAGRLRPQSRGGARCKPRRRRAER